MSNSRTLGTLAPNAGYMNIPQNSQSVAYTLVLSDSGKHIYHPSADTTARTWTIPANTVVAFPIGTSISFINDLSAGVQRIEGNVSPLMIQLKPISLEIDNTLSLK